jgi:hypothetical protein
LKLKRCAGVKIVYLDQNHWIELARAAHGRESKPGVPEVLSELKRAAARREACFPLSLGHWMETFKQRAPDRRSRLASVMLDLSGGLAVAAPHVVMQHEAEAALSRAFPGRIPLPPPLAYLGRGFAHAADAPFGFSLDWPDGSSAIPEDERKTLESQILASVELSVLSATLPGGQHVNTGPLTDLTADRRFKAGLAEWRGAAARYAALELERRIYATTLADMEPYFRVVLAKHRVAIEDFASLGEPGWCRILDDMPSRRADMHLRREWAKNAQLTPKDSDLNDWAYLEVAVMQCDVVVTEKQTCDLFGRGLSTRAAVVASLADVPMLLA